MREVGIELATPRVVVDHAEPTLHACVVAEEGDGFAVELRLEEADDGHTCVWNGMEWNEFD